MPRRRQPTEWDREAGRKLADKRRAAGLTQAALGEALLLSAQQISKYERGVDKIAASVLDEAHAILDGTQAATREGFAEAHQVAYLANDPLAAVRHLRSLMEAATATLLELERTLGT